MADTAALVVALSAQLTKFEKDMKSAVGIAERRTKEIENVFSKMNAGITNQLSNLAGSGGGIASGLARLGPAGLAAGAGLGAITLAFLELNKAVQVFAKQADQLRNAADTTGLTVSQLKQLSTIGLEVGVSAEQSETAIGKMTIAVDELRKASGPLWDRLREINPALVSQVTNAGSTAEAIDILARAYEGLGSQFAKNEFLKAVFGRGGLPFGRVLTEIARLQGGLQGVADTRFDKVITDVDKLADEIAVIQQKTADLWGRAFATDVLTAQREMLLIWQQLVTAITAAYSAARQAPIEAPDPNDMSWSARWTRGAIKAKQAIKRARVSQSLGEEFSDAGFDDRFNQLRFLRDIPLPTARPEGRILGGMTPEQELAILKERTAALGDLLSKTDARRQLELQLDEAVKKGSITQAEANKKLAELGTQQSAATLAIKERLGIATQQELIDARMIPIQQALIKGDIDVTTALKAQNIARKEAVEAMEAQMVRASNLPQAMRAGLDMTNQFKQLDQAIVSTFSGFENAIADVATGSKSLKDAFKSLADSIIRDLVRMTIQLSVTGPLLKALGLAFPAGPTNIVGGAGSLAVPTFPRQHGGPVSAGRPYIVGEAGPELFVPGKSGQIVPNAVSKQGTSTGLSVIVNNYTSGDTETKQERRQGPTGEQVIIGIVKKTIASGQADGPNRSRFGLRAQKVR